MLLLFSTHKQLVSSKFYYGYDESVCIDDFIDAAGDELFTLDTLKRLELDLLDTLDWNVYVSNADFFAKLCSVERQLAQQQGCTRGWLTYTELAQLFPSMSIAQAFVAYSAVFAISYVASVFTIAGAFLVASQVPGSALYWPQMPQQQNSAAVQTPPTTTTVTQTDRLLLPNEADIDADNAVDTERRLNGSDSDPDLRQQSTEHDRNIERLAESFVPTASIANSTSSSNVFSAILPATFNNLPVNYSNGEWTQRADLSQFEFAFDWVGLLESNARMHSSLLTEWVRINCSRYDADDDDAAASRFSHAKCHQASGYETLLRWMKFM